MEEPENKYDTIDIITYINELIVQTEVTQYFKNTKSSPIELQMTIPKLANNNLTKFEMTMNNKKVVSKLIENGKAKEKYTDAIATGNYGFLSYTSKEETTICLGNIPPNEEIELKSYFFGHIITKDYSYQASFPVIFPGFILGDPKDKEIPEHYKYKKQIVKGKIYIDTFSKLTRLVINGSNNFGKIERKYTNDYKSAEIDIYKDNFSDKDIPGIIIFRTEDINKNKLFSQYDSLKDKYCYILQKTLEIPIFNLNLKETIDENEDLNYASLLETNNKEEKINKRCYIFLLDQSGSMRGNPIELCKKALLLFLQSLNKNCFFQLIGFGSNFEYYTKEPVEYNKENIKNLMDLIKEIDANKGGTELYSPLKDIYNNNIYEKYDMKKHIILLTDGEIRAKEDTLNLIGSHSNDFYFHSLGIGDCDKDLIERSAIIGNGYSYYINNLDDLNKTIISVLDKIQSGIKIECECAQTNFIENEKQKYINLNDFFRHGVILDNNTDNIIFKLRLNEKEEKIDSKNLEIYILPDGEELGKLIVDNYLTNNKSLDFRTKIKLSKDYNILCSETAFFAEIQNEVPITQKMTLIENKNKEAINNNLIHEINLRNIGYENKSINFNNNNIEVNEKKKGFFSIIFSIFSCKKSINEVINKKKYEYKEKPNKLENSRKSRKIKNNYFIESECCNMKTFRNNIKCDYFCNINCSIENDKECSKEINVINEIKSEEKIINFDEIILSQDILEGNWKKDSQIEMLIEKENYLYEKINKYSENKGLKEENGIITLFILYYIFDKKKEKVDELKFVIDKAKNYIKKIYNLDYDEIIKELDSN